MDRDWWKEYLDRVIPHFSGERISVAQHINSVQFVRFNHGQNSGLGAILLAAHFGAQEIIMLGYDCGHTDGKTHWHGDHPKTLGNAGKVNQWPRQFERMLPLLKGVNVINASRVTALDMFPKAELEEVLQ